MNPIVILRVIQFLFRLSTLAAGMLIVYRLLSFRQRATGYLALAIGALMLRQVLASITLFYILIVAPDALVSAVAVIVSAAGDFLEATGTGIVALYMLGILNGIHVTIASSSDLVGVPPSGATADQSRIPPLSDSTGDKPAVTSTSHSTGQALSPLVETKPLSTDTTLPPASRSGG